MKTFDEYWEKHATDEFLSKEGVKTLCDDMHKKLIEENKRIESVFINYAPTEIVKEYFNIKKNLASKD